MLQQRLFVCRHLISVDQRPVALVECEGVLLQDPILLGSIPGELTQLRIVRKTHACRFQCDFEPQRGDCGSVGAQPDSRLALLQLDDFLARYAGLGSELCLGKPGLSPGTAKPQTQGHFTRRMRGLLSVHVAKILHFGDHVTNSRHGAIPAKTGSFQRSAPSTYGVS